MVSIINLKEKGRGAALEGGQESNRVGSFATENPAAPSMKGSVKLT